ncbi:MAG: serine hydroxymethyltransferase [Candidatus Moranbacteria bacterium RBG_13_45_13]|nr:MAG: serine hydroxymethyltransferase [Candidatus Moranbacteria bacterium RBG_13_45_13]
MKQRDRVYKHIREEDKEIFAAISGEIDRQQWGLEMIPSESYASRAVLEAIGSVLENKYSEGYPKKRYYGGQKYTDIVEQIAIRRAKSLFRVDHANVQPYSGSPANFAALNAVCAPGDTIMGMDLRFGGHLTHGWKVNVTAKYFNSVSYTTDRNGYIDFGEIEKLAKKHRPKVIICGATAYPRVIDFEKFARIARRVGAYLMADIAHIAGLVAAGVHPSPVGQADIITTTTHKTLRGPRAGMIMCNGNPSDPLKPVKNPTKKDLPTLIDRSIFPGLQGGPHMHTIAGIAVALKEASTKEFREWAKQVVKNAQKLAEIFNARGLRLATGGTDNHLILMDVTPFKISGTEAEKRLDRIGVTLNKNMIPHDPRPPFDPSGIRLGTPCVTIRGMKEKEMEILGNAIADTLESRKNMKKSAKVMKELCRKFPLYKNL